MFGCIEGQERAQLESGGGRVMRGKEGWAVMEWVCAVFMGAVWEQ